MFAQERPEYEAACNATADLYARGGGIVAIDGPPGSGKTGLAKYLSWRCDIALIQTDLFVRPDGGRLAYRMEHIRDIIVGLRNAGCSVILDGAIAQQTLDELGYPPDLVIRVSAIDAPKSDEPLQSQLVEYDANYRRADLPLFMLPLPNEDAHGLLLTEREWKRVQQVIMPGNDVRKAWVFGSRATGRRRVKEAPEPLDIDLAILPSWPPEEENGGVDVWKAAEFRAQHSATIADANISLHWHEGGQAEADAWHLQGKLILDRG